MIELVFIACLKDMPDSCEERVLSYLDQGGPTVCMMLAPPTLAEWIGTHPAYTLKHWRCREPGERAIKI